MARYAATVETAWDREVAFTYLADFTTISDWDPGVVRSKRLTGDPLSVGARFEVTTSYLGREATLTYNVGPVGGQGNWTVGVVGRNLHTWTKYRGYDPEVGHGGQQLNNAALNGLDYFSFPNLRTFTLQVSTAF